MFDRPSYRIFDMKENKFFEPTYKGYKGEIEDLSICPHGDLLLRTIDNNTHESVFPNRYMVDMFTGRTDTKDAYIHVRDIVVINGGPNDGRVGAVYFDSEKLAYVVKGSFLFNRMELHEGYTFTIIGNCHQNQDLLLGGETNV